MAPLFLLALVSAARSSTDTTRSVDVLLGTVALAYTARSATALPYGADLRVLLALIQQVTETGEVRLTVPALLQAAGLGYGGRQHEALFAALDRLAAVTYTVQQAPAALGLPGAFRLVMPAFRLPGGELQIEVSPEMLAQVLRVRANPAPTFRPEIPSSALALYGVLDTLQQLPGQGQTGALSLPLLGLCELLGLSGRPDNARRALLAMVEDLRSAGYISRAEIRGQGRRARLEIADAGPDAESVALLCGERVSRSRATTFVRRHGAAGVRRCLNRAREVRADMEDRGGQVKNWTGLLCNVLDDPDRYGALVAPVVPAPVAPPSAVTPLAEPDVVYDSADVIRLVRALGKGTLKEPHQQALRQRLDGGHEDPQAWGRRLSQAVASDTIVEVLEQLAQELTRVASPRPGGPLGQDVLIAAGEQRSGALEG
ncbi:hypothetical protein [Deinococcus radiopugnans]|uniref:Uncharacterized protein n=1 Tax=Deinococcus radiopugnans ATCC 19172 TaxID=585398 RepID=A0A5C4Y6I5_9DEIO|nr:hypothetical protein [Deinococcus radiopugnans]MBB6017779.1 hypothetical protein [Deinococcus radiopugnans ATCC 19172]TNM71422.1 hypothetical protein FHR04_07655 [Deinococcus radiopugnans ATCC 19172]